MNKKGFEFDTTVIVVAAVLWVIWLVLFVGVFSMTKGKLFGGVWMFLLIAACSIPIAYFFAYRIINQ